MTPALFVEALSRRGIRLAALPGGDLEVRGAKHLRPKDREILRRRKGMVVGWLRSQSEPTKKIAVPLDAQGLAALEQALVRCGDCRRFQPDQIGDGSGIGTCQAGRQPQHPEPPLYPTAPRLCGKYKTEETMR